jgi:hypothetical protein
VNVRFEDGEVGCEVTEALKPLPSTLNQS